MTRWKRTITQDALKQALNYDPGTGLFTRIRDSKRYKIGQVAGCNAPTGYVVIRVDGELHGAHLWAWVYMTGEWPEAIDHINGDKQDNRWCNLRPANKVQNGCNRGKQKNNSSGYKGVDFHSQSGRWRARAKHAGKNCHIGLFTTKHEAAAAYKAFVEKHHGEFARV